MRALIVSAPTLDSVSVEGSTRRQVGGPAFYAGLALRALGYEVYAVGPYGPLTQPTVRREAELGIRRLCCEGGEGLLMSHVYDGGVRRSRRLGSVRPLDAAEVLDAIGVADPDLVIVSPNYDEVPLEALRALAEARRRYRLALDVQGYARSLGSEWWRALEGVEADLVHLSDDDADESVARALGRLFPSVLFTLGPGGAMAIARGRVTAMPSRGFRLRDRTGAGDVILALTAHYHLIESMPLEDAYERSADLFARVMVEASSLRSLE